MFELNIRASLVLGLVGAGGIGRVIETQRSTFNFDRLLGILIIMFVIVDHHRTDQRGDPEAAGMTDTDVMFPDDTDQPVGRPTAADGQPATGGSGSRLPWSSRAMWSWTGLDASFQDVLDAPGKGWTIVKQMWPPDFKTVIDRGAVGKIFESLYVAWIGTMIGAVALVPALVLRGQQRRADRVPGPDPDAVQRDPGRAGTDRGDAAADRRPGSARGPVRWRSGCTRSARSASSRPR